MPLRWLLALLLTTQTALAVAAAAVEVRFVAPDGFTDLGQRGYAGPRRDAVLDAVRAHLQQLGARYLPPGQRVMVEVLDIDLAGRFEPWSADGFEVRILRDITWPRIKLRYRWLDGAAELAAAEEVVADMNYLRRAYVHVAGDTLQYEKRMLDEWFRRRFGAGRIGIR